MKYALLLLIGVSQFSFAQDRYSPLDLLRDDPENVFQFDWYSTEQRYSPYFKLAVEIYHHRWGKPSRVDLIDLLLIREKRGKYAISFEELEKRIIEEIGKGPVRYIAFVVYPAHRDFHELRDEVEDPRNRTSHVSFAIDWIGNFQFENSMDLSARTRFRDGWRTIRRSISARMKVKEEVKKYRH